MQERRRLANAAEGGLYRIERRHIGRHDRSHDEETTMAPPTTALLFFKNLPRTRLRLVMRVRLLKTIV